MKTGPFAGAGSTLPRVAEPEGPREANAETPLEWLGARGADARHAGIARGVAAPTAPTARFTPVEPPGMYGTWLDGTEILREHLEHVADTTRRRRVIRPWSRGDVVAIDDRSVSHRRLPCRGPRAVAVARA